MVRGLGVTLYKALDFGIEEEEERTLSPELDRLINELIGSKYLAITWKIFPGLV